jgi:signal transduction histidine kinase
MGFGKFWDGLLSAIGVVVALLSLTSWVSGEVSKVGDALHFSVGSILFLYILAIGTFIFLLLRTFLKIIHRTRGREKMQAIYILVGFTVTPLLALITNAIIPSITHSWHSASLGPSFTVLLVGTIAYAIIKHRLFDIRSAVARSLAYALAIIALVVIYIVAVFGLAYFVLGIRFTIGEELFFASASVATAFLFRPIKIFFDKMSNRLFYRDAYDPQDVLDAISALLVRTVHIDEIESRTKEILSAALHLTSVTFLLSKDVEGDQKVLLNELLKSDLVVASTDDLSESKHSRIADHLRRLDVALIARLRTTHEDLGFLLLGYRHSGALYSGVDQRIVGLVTDELAIAMQNAFRFQEIEGFNLTLQQKVDEATKKLRHTNERLRILDQTKDDFISMASHQLRTPLTSVKGYVSMVLDGDGGKINDTQRKLLTQSFLSSQRMVYLISDLLNVSRLKTGKFIIEPVESSLDKVIEEELDQLTETVKARGLELNYHKPEHFPMLMLDETKIRQVIMNFVDNAIYYTPSGGHINVYLVDKPDSIEFTVVDDGIGVPKHEQHHLFSKFYRAKNAKNARPDGTGLGIFMAKKVVIAQGGAVIFSSTEGKGSTFGFTFPKAKLLPAKQEKTATKA